jgi:hypothetical protein
MGNKLGTGWGPIENLMRTHWEQIGNEKKTLLTFLCPSYYQFLSSLRMLANIDFSIIMCLFRTLEQLFLKIYISPNFDLENMSSTHAKDFA